MSIEIVELGRVGRETKGNENPNSPQLEPMVKGLFCTEDDDEQV